VSARWHGAAVTGAAVSGGIATQLLVSLRSEPWLVCAVVGLMTTVALTMVSVVAMVVLTAARGRNPDQRRASLRVLELLLRRTDRHSYHR
jgi:hypothetical protein